MEHETPRPTAPLDGQHFVAKVRLSNKASETLAEPGDTCERVPASSLGWLLEQGLIEAVRPNDGEIR